MLIDKATLREIVSLLKPHCGSPDDRRALFTLALGFDHPLMDQLDFHGRTDVFVVNAIQPLLNTDGEPGKTALWALLEEVATRVGEADKKRIAALEAKLNPATPPPAPPNTDIADIINAGKTHLKDKSHAAAIAAFSQALQIDPNQAEVYALRATAYKRTGSFDLAIDDYTQALKLDPKKVMYLEERARAYTRKRDYSRAIEDYTAAIKLRPKRAGLYHLRGVVYKKQGALDKARADFERAADMGYKQSREALEKL